MKSYLLLLSVLWLPVSIAVSVDYDAATKSFRGLLKELVEADTTNPPGNEARAVKILAERLKKEGIAFEITEFAPGRQNIIARLKGNGSLKPVMVIAHIDVVGTAGQAWSVSNPHTVTEKDGKLIGRGVSDDLGMATAAIETLALIKKSGVELKRDIIVALTGDEESGGLGIRQVLKDRPDLVDAVVAINEGGGLLLEPDGRKMKLVNLQVGEKTYEDFVVTAKGPTGHSSTPLKDNAIYRLARAVNKFEKYQFPLRLLPTHREYILKRSALEKEPLAGAMKKLALSKGKFPADALKVIESDLSISTLLRTTCVATMLKGGTKENALPAEASVSINCRILPDETPQDVKNTIAKVMADPTLEIQLKENEKPGGASPLVGEGPEAIRKVVEQMYPGLTIIPTIARGATDSRFLRQHGIASYGFSPLANTEIDSRKAHGVDESIPVSSIKPGIEILHRLLLTLAAAAPAS